MSDVQDDSKENGQNTAPLSGNQDLIQNGENETKPECQQNQDIIPNSHKTEQHSGNPDIIPNSHKTEQHSGNPDSENHKLTQEKPNNPHQGIGSMAMHGYLGDVASGVSITVTGTDTSDSDHHHSHKNFEDSSSYDIDSSSFRSSSESSRSPRGFPVIDEGNGEVLRLERVYMDREVKSSRRIKKRLSDSTELLLRTHSTGNVGVEIEHAERRRKPISSRKTVRKNKKKRRQERESKMLELRERIEEMERELEGIAFDEEDSPANIVYNENGSIKLATFEKLIEKLTDTQTDISVNPIFLLTYHEFKTPVELLLLFKKRLAGIINDSSKSFRVFNLINQWIKKYFYDWMEDKSMKRIILDDIAEISKSAGMNQYGEKLMDMYKKQKNKVKFEMSSFHNIGWGTKNPPTPRLPNHSSTSFMDFDPEEVARQLTLIESTLFRNISPSEIFTKAWTTKDKKSAAPNISALTNHFNRMTYWVQTEILKRESPKKRAAVIARYLDIADYCMELKNFMGAYEIFSGIDASPLKRIPKTFELLKQHQQEQLQVLTSFFGTDSNHIVMRNELKVATPPCVPFIGVYLSDIMFIGDGALDEVDGLINFNKRKKVADVLSEVMKFQETYYCLLYVKDIRNHLLTAEAWGDSTLYDYASFREPKEGRSVKIPQLSYYTIPEDTYPKVLMREEPNPSEYHSMDGTLKKKKKFGF